MAPTITLAVLFVLVAWAIVAYAIWHWGPGLRWRPVRCPVINKRAKVLAEQREALFVPSYAGLTVTDIKACSLFKGGPLKCHKECLPRL